MEERKQIFNIPSKENLQNSFLEAVKDLQSNQEIDLTPELNIKQQSIEVLNDVDENETIFKQSKSTLLNSLFEESKSLRITDQFSENSDSKKSLSLNLQNDRAMCLTEDKAESIISQNKIDNLDTNIEVCANNNSSNKTNSQVSEEKKSHESSERNNNCFQETLKDGIASNSPIKSKNLNITSRNPRPTLAEDSKLVKISLPTNPINLMQSNAQFLNKSRNFFNFITEKSTNIMEKTLLPHHITGRYNSIMKLTDSNVKKTVEDSCTSSESSSTDLTSNSETDLAKIPRSTDKPVHLNTVKFKDESGIYGLDSNKSRDETNCDPGNRNKNIENSLDLDLRFHKCELEKQGSCYNDNFVERNSLIAKTNGQHNTNNDTPLESQDSSPRLLSEDDSEADSSYREDSIDSAISKSPNNELHSHPTYLTLLRDYATLRKENEKLVEKITRLEEKNQKLEVEKNRELQNEEMVSMERTINRLTSELKVALENQECFGRKYITANKERESMVMKYAVSEKQLIDAQRAKSLVEKKLQEVLKENDLLQSKLRQAQGERTRICNILDKKCAELVELQKQVDRFKEDINMKEVKFKWTQNKLKSEMDLQKETQHKLEVATVKINEMREECQQVRWDAQETMRKFQESEENKAVTLDQQLKEQQARLILERHLTEDKEFVRLQLQKEVETLKHRQQTLIDENNILCLKLQDLEKDRLSYENSMSNLKSIADQRQKEIIDLLDKVSQLETLKVQLKQQEQCLSSNEAEIERLRQTNQDLQLDMDSCKKREAHMLEFTQKLTDTNVRLQSEFTTIETRNQLFEKEQGPLHDHITELMSKVKFLEKSLVSEQKKKIEDCEILAKHVAEQTQLVQNLTQKLEDSEGENTVLRRKYQLSLKEMTRELQHCRKRLEMVETASPSISLDPTSRTGSSTSLNTGETLNGALSDNSNSIDHSIQLVDRQSLIDKIVKMQKNIVKKAEKIDFLEEHVRSLVEELQKKTKIIQNYILIENFDAMSSNERDKNKAELAKYGGIMASVYNHKVSDDHMTLELSLEINQKLQSVLEDTLLKNITLKDNIDTLGEEIAKLTMEIQQRQIIK